MSIRLQNNSFDQQSSGNERAADKRNQFAKTKPFIERSGSQQRVEQRVFSTKEVGEQRGPDTYKRSHKISSLQQEFEELKKKIKEVENKNEKIIEKIQHNKNGQKRAEDAEASDSSVEYMRNSDQHIFRTAGYPPHPSSTHSYKNKKDCQSECLASQGQKRDTPLFKRNSYREPKPLLSSEKKQSEVLERVERSSSKQRYDPPIAKLDSMRLSDVGGSTDKQLREKLEQQVKSLEERLKKEEYKYECLRSNFKSYSDCLKLIVQNQLERFMEGVVAGGFRDIERRVRRNKEKMDRVSDMVGKYAMSKLIEGQKMLPELSVVVRRNNLSASDYGDEVPPLQEKSRYREFENLVEKYEQLIRTKNQESETVLIKLKMKDKELSDLKMTVDRLKDAKRKVENEADEKIAKLDVKLASLNDQNKKLTLDLDKAVKLAKANSSAASTDIHPKRFAQPSAPGDAPQEAEKLKQQLEEMTASLRSSEKALAEKNKALIMLERELLDGKEKRKQLMIDNKKDLDDSRLRFKSKLEEHARTYDEVRIQVAKKDQIISELENRQRQHQQKEAELKVEISSLQQRLDLKESMEKIRESQYNELLKQYQEKTLTHSSSHANTNELPQPQLNQARDSKVGQAELRQLRLENEKLVSTKKSDEQTIRQLEQSNRQTESEVKELRAKISSLTAEMKQQMSSIRRCRVEGEQEVNQLQASEKEERELEFEALIREKNKQLEILESHNEQLRQQNISVHSKVISLENEIKFAEEIKQQNNVKIKELRRSNQSLDQFKNALEKDVARLQKDNEIEKARHKEEFLNLDHQLKIVEDEFNNTYRLLELETEKVAQKTIELKRVQEELVSARKAWAEAELVRADNERMKAENEKSSLKISDMEEELRHYSISKDRISQEYKTNLTNLHQSLEKLTIEKVNFEEENKFLKNKIQELELEMFVESQSVLEGDTLSQSDVKTESLLNKVKTLEKASVEQEITRANLQRHLRQSEENCQRLERLNREYAEELDKNKSQFYKISLGYDEKIQEQEQMIRELEKVKEEQMQPRIDQTRKSELKSQSSLMFSMASQGGFGDKDRDKDKEIDFNLSEVSQYFEPNVETIFEKADYPYQRLKLRRKKDQVQLLEKTAQYINNLKKTINDKNRKIKNLEKRLSSNGRGSELPIKSFEEGDTDDMNDNLSDFNDNYSVEFDNRRGDNRRKLRQLENETHLVMEENNLLLQKVESLQEELEHAEEQENGLIRMKEIYKEEISKLRKALEQKDVSYNKEIIRLQKRIEESEGTHNMETVRQLITKIFSILFSEERKEEKRKEVEEYVKVLTNVLKLDNPIKQRAWIWRR